MTTPSRPEINRANSQHSTGPITPEGKHRSSLNALRHGLTGQIVVMPSEDLAAYQRHLKSYTDAFAPQGPLEADLVQALADTSWRLNRVAALETNVLCLAVADPESPIETALTIAAAIESRSKALANLSMHSQRLSRQFERTQIQLRELQKIRHDQESHDLDDLLDVLEMYKAKGQTYNPSADGFVFTEPQIRSAFQARTRKHQILKAYIHKNAA